MKTPLIVSLVALVLSAVAFVTLLVRSSAPESGAAPAALPVAPAPDVALLARVDALAEENDALRKRLARLELRPAPARTPAGPDLVSREEFDAFREEVLEALGSRVALAKGAYQEPEVLKEQVASTLSEIRRDEAAETARRKLEGRLKSLEQAMPKYESWLQLTPRQSGAMQSALLARYEREAELLRRWQAGEDPEVLGEVKRSDYQTHREELSGILTPTQFETYWNRVEQGGKGGGRAPGGADRGK